MPTLGLAMIVRDEEQNLARCLSSVKSVVDEIVIVDTGSVDNTKAIAQSFGARIFDFTWIDDFSAARNFSFSKVTAEWILWLDGDDEILPADLDRLASVKNRLGDADTYLMDYNYAQDAHGNPLVRMYNHRIIRNDGRVKWVDPIHEFLAIPPDYRQETTNVVVTHRRTQEAKSKDLGRNLRILRKAVKNNPESQRLKFYLGKELNDEGIHDEAIPVMEGYLKRGDWHDNMVYAHLLLGFSYASRRQIEQAIDAASRGIRLDPRWSELYSLIGQIYYDQGDWGQAARWFEIAYKLPMPDSSGFVRTEYYTWLPADRLTKCYAELGRWHEANQMNEVALRYLPSEQRMLFNREYLRDKLFDRLSDRPVRVNLGSGQKHEPSFRNCDFYPGPGVEFVLDQTSLPWRTATVHAIHSEHSLEHSQSHAQARRAIKEWARVLRHRGRLTLKVPDLDECCRLFHAQSFRPRKAGERYTPKEWFMYTIYGIQESQGSEPPEGQYHRTGFTKAELRRLLEENGFRIERLVSYDGWGTPSIEVQAVRERKAARVRWLMRSLNDDDPSNRIRRLNIHRWLASHEVESAVTLMHERVRGDLQEKNDGALFAELREADVVIFSSFTQKERRLMDMLRRAGVAAVADYNEDIADQHPDVAACLGSATMIVCCSKVLANKASAYGRSVCIPDAYESIPQEAGTAP